MQKLIAIVNVIAWGGFWAFGYLALTAEPDQSTQVTVAAILAALGGGTGMVAYLWLVRHSEATGYARARARAAHGAPDAGAEADGAAQATREGDAGREGRETHEEMR